MGRSSLMDLPSTQPWPERGDICVLLITEDELSDTAEHYRLKLTLDGYRVLVTQFSRVTAQYVRDVAPDFVVLEIRRLTSYLSAVWAKLRWGRGRNRTPIIVLSSERKERLSKIGIKFESGDHFVEWPRSSGLSVYAPR